MGTGLVFQLFVLGIDHMPPATCTAVYLKQFGRTFAQRRHYLTSEQLTNTSGQDGQVITECITDQGHQY